MPPHGRVTGYGRNPNAMPPTRSVRFGGDSRILPPPTASSFPWNNGRTGQMGGAPPPSMLDWKNGGRMMPPQQPGGQVGFGGGAGMGTGLMDSSFSGENIDSTSDPNQRGMGTPTPGFDQNVDDDLLSKLARWIHIGGRR